MQSRVHVTVRCLSVPSVDHCNNVRRVAAGGKAISIDCCMAGAQQQPRRSSGVQRTNVGSATLSADVGSWTADLFNSFSCGVIHVQCVSLRHITALDTAGLLLHTQRGLSVCLCVCACVHACVCVCVCWSCKNGWTDRDAVWDVTRVTWGPNPPPGKRTLWQRLQHS